MSIRVRNKIQCYCKVCNGKPVDERTRDKHDELERNLASSISGFIPLLPSRDSSSNLEAANIGCNIVTKKSSRKDKEQTSEVLMIWQIGLQ